MSVNTPSEVIRTQIATHNAASPVGVKIMANQTGRHSRTQESVQVTPSQSDLTDALEAIGMSVATRGTKAGPEKMKLRRGQGTNFEALGRIADYYDKLPSMPADEKRRNLIAQFKQVETLLRMTAARGDGEGGASGLPTADDIRKLLADFDGDITHQFVMLEDIRNRAAQEGAPAGYLSLLDTVRADMRRPENARDILAGFASARVATDLGDRFGSDPTEYRESYRALLREQPRLGRVFDELRKFNLTDNFNEIVGGFLKVAGDDMASFGPSTDPLILGDVVRELSNLKTLRTAFEGTAGVLAKIDRMYQPGPDSARPGGEELTSRLLHFSGGQIASMAEAEALLTGFEPTRPEVGVAVINLLRDLHAALPDSVVTSPQAREQQGRMLLALSDTLVAAEEATYGNG
jgi:type III secretion system YopN/LcrE/InvE/MxiC family regulator